MGFRVRVSLDTSTVGSRQKAWDHVVGEDGEAGTPGSRNKESVDLDS